MILIYGNILIFIQTGVYMQKINNPFNFGRSITDFWYHYSSRNKTIKDVLGPRS